MRSAQKKQRLAVVMFTDMVGYSALTGRDEKLSRELVEEHRSIIRKSLASFEGEEISTTGDGFMIEFSSAIRATHCAIEIQTHFFERNLTRPEEHQIKIRIGLHLGDIHEVEDDRFGNEVNIAARVEPLAPAGGICMTRQVVDQIQRKIDFPLRSLGKLPLKNIAVPPEVFHLVLPWEARPLRVLDVFSLKGLGILMKRAKHAFSKSHTLEGKLVALQTLAVVGMVGWICFEVGRSLTTPLTTHAGRFVLPHQWQYSMSTAENEVNWKPFDVDHTAQYSDELQGDYQLKLEFTGTFAYQHPSLILGMIAESHRAYLNGQFIGGSENHSDLVKYNFDPKLIQSGKTNTLVVKAHSRATIYPGLHLVPKVPSFIGEFEDTSQVATSDETTFQILESIFLSFSLLIAFASLGFTSFRKSDLPQVYFTLLLFLGSLHLSYHNRFVVNAIPYQVSYFTQILAFGLSGFALFSLDLHQRGKRKEEWINNGLAIASCVAAGIYLFSTHLSPSEYVTRYHLIFSVLTFYNRAWLASIGVRGLKRVYEMLRHRAIPERSSLNAFFAFTFGVAILLICNSVSTDAATEHVTGFWSYFSHSSALIRFLSKTYPFIFALFVLFNGVMGYVRKSRENSYKQRKDELILSLASLSSNCKSSAEAASVIQHQVTEFLQASRSTIYLVEEEQVDGIARIHPEKQGLKATFFYGPDKVKNKIETLLGPDQGLIGHCLKNRSPIWVEDIHQDPRFQKENANRLSTESTYQTGSFIIVPLVFAGKLLGVITVADRLDLKPFTQEDFCLMLLASKDLAMILGNSAHFQTPAILSQAS